MTKTDKRIDAYIAKAQEFARPILRHLRAVVHEACPDVSENIKWGCPHFEYEGKILCSMASFNEHCAFGFRLGSLMKDPLDLMQQAGEKSGMGHFGRIENTGQLPKDKVLIQYIREAMALTKQGARKPIARVPATRKLEVPDYFSKALKKDKHAFKAFNDFTYSDKKEYVEWITEAKTNDTRDKRVRIAVEWIRERKPRNWKYKK